MRDRRAFQAHETKVRRRGIVVNVEAKRAEETLMVLEDAIGAETTMMGSVANVVEEEGRLFDAAAVARRRRWL
ncbi:hypothetical protein L6164_013788 [Bauhinia variegata]|uniref:Uncharacterized protein n=1 Tax=Bauhinia variegata TaxID=167791 RepID=A0ACB9NFB8_BAUVA|nr:hypothetical protein L6164_013788 [Bauhinia variegata]